MKNKIVAIILSAVMALSLSACSASSGSKELNEYKKSMESFFSALEKADETINAIDPDNQEAMELLYESFADLESAYYTMAELTVPLEDAPDTFVYIEPLADEAYDYMLQASEYMHDAYSDSSYNENVLEAAMECYKRASKRVLYIIDLLHGEIPSDENISITVG